MYIFAEGLHTIRTANICMNNLGVEELYVDVFIARILGLHFSLFILAVFIESYIVQILQRSTGIQSLISLSAVFYSYFSIKIQSTIFLPTLKFCPLRCKFPQDQRPQKLLICLIEFVPSFFAL